MLWLGSFKLLETKPGLHIHQSEHSGMNQQSFVEKKSKTYPAVLSCLPMEWISQPVSEWCEVIKKVEVGFKGAEHRGKRIRKKPSWHKDTSTKAAESQGTNGHKEWKSRENLGCWQKIFNKNSKGLMLRRELAVEMGDSRQWPCRDKWE